MINQDARERVFALLPQIPLGKVSTYKQIAQLAGLKNPRYVGRILHTNTDSHTYPCHRVIKSDGRLAAGYAFGEQHGQLIRLRKEGVVCLGGKIDLKEFGWDGVLTKKAF